MFLFENTNCERVGGVLCQVDRALSYEQLGLCVEKGVCQVDTEVRLTRRSELIWSEILRDPKIGSSKTE